MPLSSDPEKRARSLANLEKGQRIRAEQILAHQRAAKPPAGRKVGSYEPPEPPSDAKPKAPAKPPAARRRQPARQPQRPADRSSEHEPRRGALRRFLEGFAEG